jgi:20S proteasome alpha/beta subunit
MSLLVCFLGIDGLVLATDSRGTFGDPRGVTAQNDLIKKLYVANNRVGVLVAGAGDLGSTVMSGFLNLPDTQSLGVTELTMALHQYTRKQFGEWFQRFAIKQVGADSRPVRPELNLLVAGFDLNREAKIFSLSSSLDFGPMLHNYGFGVDRVAQYALSLVNRLYDPVATMDDLQYLVAYVITETANQDGKVGGPIQLATIGAAMPLVLDASAIKQLVLANSERSRALKSSFLTNQYKGGRAQPPDSLKLALGSSLEAANSPTPYGVSVRKSSAALSTVAEESFGICSPGFRW